MIAPTYSNIIISSTVKLWQVDIADHNKTVFISFFNFSESAERFPCFLCMHKEKEGEVRRTRYKYSGVGLFVQALAVSLSIISSRASFLVYSQFYFSFAHSYYDPLAERSKALSQRISKIFCSLSARKLIHLKVLRVIHLQLRLKFAYCFQHV